MHLEAEINKAAFSEPVSRPPKELWGGSASAILGAGTLWLLRRGPEGGEEEHRPLLTALRLGRPVSSVLCSQSLRSDLMAAACPVSERPSPHGPKSRAPTPGIPSWVPAPISNCSLGSESPLPSPEDPLWGKEALLSWVLFLGGGGGFPLQFRGERLPLSDTGQWAVSSMVFFRSSRCSSQSSSGSYVPLTTATRSLRLRELGKSR